jgi:hypothetical protein
MHCDRKEVRDVFLSQGIDETEKQDVLIGSVLSIKPNVAFGNSFNANNLPIQVHIHMVGGLPRPIDVHLGDGNFHVTMEASDWVMMSHADGIKQLDVGDSVRIGSLSNNRAMDYTAHVLEKVKILSLANGCVCPMGATDAGPSTTSPLHCPEITLHIPDETILSAAVVPQDRTAINGVYARDNHVAITQVLNTASRSLYAYRLSVSSDWTRVTATFPYTHLQPLRSAADLKTLIELRDMNIFGNAQTAQRPFPLYKMQTFSSLRADLGQNIKNMDWIKLIGYSVDDEVTSSQVHRGQLHLKQWVAVHVKGLIGTTISNEPAAHGAFAVLHCADKIGGGVHMHDSKGLHVRDFNGGSPLRELHLDFKTATGEPAKLRGIHLWFQICTSHG